MHLKRRWTILALAGCATWACSSEMGGSLGIRVWFPFSVKAIPPETETIRVLVHREVQMLGQMSLSRSGPSGTLRTLPGGDVEVLAVAFDAWCRPVASGKTTAHIVPLTTARAELELGGADPTVVQYVQTRLNPPCATPAPTASPSAGGVAQSPDPTFTAIPTPSGSAQTSGQVTVTNGSDLTINPSGAPYP